MSHHVASLMCKVYGHPVSEWHHHHLDGFTLEIYDIYECWEQIYFQVVGCIVGFYRILVHRASERRRLMKLLRFKKLHAILSEILFE